MNNIIIDNSLPLVTIGVASYNNARFVLETLNSIAQQHYPQVELIVVDDYSTDNSSGLIAEWIKKYDKEVMFIQHKSNSGICRAANEMLDSARGKYFMIVGSDDILLENKLLSQVTQLERLGEDYALSYSDVFMISEDGEPIQEDFHNKHFKQVEGEAFDLLLEQNFVQAPSTLYRTAVIRELGGYDENLSFEDLDVLLRLTRKYKIAYNDYKNAKYRRMSTSLSGKFSVKHTNSLLLLLEKHYGISSKNDALIDSYVLNNAEIIYREGGKLSAHWMKRKWQIQGGLKARTLYILSALNISYKTVIKLGNFLKFRPFLFR